MTARGLAFSVLLKMHRGAYSNISLDAALSSGVQDARERALASALVYGVTERRLTLDYQLERCLDKPLKKLKPEVLCILRMGAYQLLFMEKIPQSAAVNESVKLAKNNGCGFAASLVNAVLRRVQKNGLCLPSDKGTEEFLSIKYSCAPWIVKLWTELYGREETEKLLAFCLEAPPLTIRVNTLRTTKEKLTELLLSEGVAAEDNDICENALNINKIGVPVDSLSSFKKGLFHVQDAACQSCCEALEPKPGQTVLDLCAAPGGKSMTVAELMENKGTVKAFDIYPSRTELIDSASSRLGLNCVQSCVSDASLFRQGLCGADRVLCDVPCSGLGIISRKPEIKYKSLEEICDLPEIQYSILSNGARYVKKGGRLVYSTCTLNPGENEAVCERFLREHRGFSLLLQRTFLPHRDRCDGFFYAVFDCREVCSNG